MVKTAKAVAADDVQKEVKEHKVMWVKLLRKYCPHYCYERTDDGSLQLIVNEETGELLHQHKVIIGETLDKHGRKIPEYRQVNESYPAGTAIPLPRDEAERALDKGIAGIIVGRSLA